MTTMMAKGSLMTIVADALKTVRDEHPALKEIERASGAVLKIELDLQGGRPPQQVELIVLDSDEREVIAAALASYDAQQEQERTVRALCDRLKA